MDSSSYIQLIEETRSVVLEYAEQEWPVIKKSVSSAVTQHSRELNCYCFRQCNESIHCACVYEYPYLHYLKTTDVVCAELD